MNISPVSYGNTYNTPNFKGAPKLNGATVNTVASMGAKIKDGVNKGWDDFIEKGIIKPILKPVMNSKFMSKFADWSANVNNLPSHMATAGSFVTTYFYANRTLHTLNKDEEQKKRAKTLVLNQVLVTGVSTALAYGANGALGKMSKNLGYKFREANQGHAKLSTRMKGFDIAKQLLIFTMMYRYVAPVFVTPVASKLSKVYENWKAKKDENHQPQLNAQTAKEVQLKPNTAAKSA
jgi:hypothetical protein